jgi:hypothetical protein
MFSRPTVWAIAFLGMIGAASAQSKGHQNSTLELAVRTDKSVYRVSDVMRLETRVTNVSVKENLRLGLGFMLESIAWTIDAHTGGGWH